jgi:uncharacterized membrane protein YgdD (TMEM256/DUF423 family)
MQKTFLLTAAILGALSVALGAFGAHKLKEIVAPDAVATFQTGVTYQFYHVFALLAVGILYATIPSTLLLWAGRCFVIGTILFSGSLYIMTVFKMTNTVGVSGIGFITPFGGMFYIAGWLLLAWVFMRDIKG